jgi:hypothetical protein
VVPVAARTYQNCQSDGSLLFRARRPARGHRPVQPGRGGGGRQLPLLDHLQRPDDQRGQPRRPQPADPGVRAGRAIRRGGGRQPHLLGGVAAADRSVAGHRHWRAAAPGPPVGAGAPPGPHRRGRRVGAAVPHSLRHSAITFALDAGASLRDVQDYAGHKDPRTTRRYDHSRDSLDRNAAYLA